MTTCEEVRSLLGVYVLGAIDPADRAIVDAHLPRCRHCRDELAGLAGLPALLGRVTEEQIAQVAPPPRMLDGLLARAAARGRTRTRNNRLRVALAAAAALVLIVGGIVTGTQVGERSRPTPTATSLVGAFTATDPTTHVSAQVQLQGKEWGTALTMRLNGATYGDRCRLIVVGRDGRRDVAGSWEITYSGGATFAGSTMIQRDDLSSLEIRTLDGRRLLTVKT